MSLSTSLSTAVIAKKGEARVAMFPGDPPIYSIIKFTADGAVRNQLAHVPLDIAKGELYEQNAYDPSSRSYVKRLIITAAGYQKLNQFAGASFSSPSSIVTDTGSTVGNPYFHRTKGELEFVKVRRIGLGRNPSGNLVAIDLTVTYNLSTYFAQDVWSKWQGRGKEAAIAAWGDLYSDGNVPDEVLGNPKKKVISCPAGVALALDLTHREVISLIHEHINRQKFAERNAVTICERNILKKFFAASIVNSANRTVGVVSWQQMDRDLMQMARAVANSNAGRVTIDGGETIAIEQAEEVVSDKEDIDSALHGDFDEDATLTDDRPEVAADERPEDNGARSKMDILRSKIRRLVANTPNGMDALRANGLANLRDVSRCMDAPLLSKIVAAFEPSK